MQARYDKWSQGIRNEYESIGESFSPTLSFNTFSPLDVTHRGEHVVHSSSEKYLKDVRLPHAFTHPQTPNHESGQEWVQATDLDPENLLDGEKGMCILPNDWPYNIPHGVKHSVIWTRVSLGFLFLRSTWLGGFPFCLSQDAILVPNRNPSCTRP